MTLPLVEITDVRHRFNVRMPARDGVELSTDFYFPAGDPPWPAIVSRTAYNKGNPGIAGLARFWVGRGYAIAIQDVRGRGDSDGAFVPYVQEPSDGYDAFEWVAGQSWSDGNIATQGASYSAQSSWLTALAKPPHLRALIMSASPSDPFVEFPTCGTTPLSLAWQRLTDGHVMQNVAAVNWLEVFEHLPLETWDERAGFSSRRWRDAMAHTMRDSYHEPFQYQHRFHEIDLPVLHISGWYDDEQIGTPLNFIGLTSRAPSEEVRRQQRLLMGPWGHAVNTVSKLGEVDFGPTSLVDLQGYMADWLDSVLGRRAPLEDPPVRIFVMGINEWRNESEWPLARTRYTDFFLHSAGNANSRLGDGSLTVHPPEGDEPPDVFTYDPERPVPFIFNPTSFQLGGPEDYSAVEQRGDVLCYTTEPVVDDIEVTGPVRLHLFASSSAVDTDFTAKLVDVHPGGFCQRLCDGVIRARYREGVDRAVPMEPGKVYKFDIDLWNTCQVFRAGHRIRLELSSSAFPKFDRNLNTGAPIGSSTEIARADNSVYHTNAYQSCLVLPIVGDSDGEAGERISEGTV